MFRSIIKFNAILWWVVAAGLNPIQAWSDTDSGSSVDEAPQSAENELASQSSSSGPEVRYWAFRLEALTVLQSEGNFYTGMVEWVPEAKLLPRLTLLTDLGFTVLRQPRGVYFVVYNLALLARYRVDQWSTEIGPGYQIWTLDQGSYFAVRVNALYHFGGEHSTLDHLLIGWTSLLGSNPYTNEVHVGVGIKF